jgi:hypothetical protein
MARTPRGKKAKAAKVAKVMHEWGKGELHSGSKSGPKVESQPQAVAIALSQAGLSKPKSERPALKQSGGHRVKNRLSKALSRRLEEGADKAKR